MLLSLSCVNCLQFVMEDTYQESVDEVRAVPNHSLQSRTEITADL